MTKESNWRIANLAWLADAPLFIDSELIASFYDAVARPESKAGKTVLSISDSKAISTSLSGELEGSIGLAEWLKSILPFLDVEAGAKVSGSRKSETESAEGVTIELYPIDSAQRQLLQLALHYAANIPGRLASVNFTEDLSSELTKDFIEALPRALVFVDFPARTRFVPMMAEVEGGKVVEIFKTIRTKLAGPTSGWPPDEPDDRVGSPAELNAKWQDYWNWYADHFNASVAIEAVETAIERGGGRVRWIDYRVPFKSSERPLHLHVSGREKFDTGVFAYNLIKRGNSHGLRMVGTLRSGPSLNVLAIFEK